MTTTANNNNERKEFVNKIGFSGSFYKFLGEDIKIGNQILYPGDYEFDYQIILDDECKNGHLTFSFTGSIKIKKGNGRYYTLISGAIEGQNITSFEIELSKEIIKSLASAKTEKKDIVGRYTENTAHLSLSDSMIYSTNCYVLKAKQITIKNLLGETKDILIPYVVNEDIGTVKNIQSIVLYDEIGKIVVSCDDGEKIECQFDGESILQSVLKEI